MKPKIYLFILGIVVLLSAVFTDAATNAPLLNPVNKEGDLASKLKKCDSKADILFLIDSSNTVGEKHFREQLQAINKWILFMTHGHPKDQFRFGMITYSTKADMVMSLKDFAGQPKAAARYVISAIEYKPGQSGVGEALKLVEMVGFDSESGHRHGVEKVIILLANAQGNTDLHPGKIAYNLRHKGITILSIGVGKDITPKYLESITHKEKFVIMAAGFSRLRYLSTELMGMVCHHYRKAPEVKKHDPCPPGQKLVKNECVIMGPTCSKKCPEDYVLVYPCLCIVEEGKCSTGCPQGYKNNKNCKCIIENPPTCNLKQCSPNYTLDYSKCKCECRKQCNENLFTLDPGSCECVCNSKCRENYILNTKKCICEKIHCPKGYILYHGKCRNDITKICPKGELLFKDICLKQSDCPNGFTNMQGICKPKCPFGTDEDGNCSNECKDGQYMLNGKCQKVTPTKCEGAAHFAVPAPLCPRTCEEPIPLTRCKVKGEPQPGCVCDPGFFLLEGKCVHASQCPNKPICLKQVDMLFMLDSSINVGEPHFFLMKSLVHSIVQEFDTNGGLKQRVSVLAFNEQVHQRVAFKDFEKVSHEDMLKEILEMKYKPGEAFLGEALHYARSQVFAGNNGMREDVPRMLMLLTRGNPSSGTLDAVWEARKIREAGITLVLIGIGENIESKTEYLHELAGSGDKVFMFALRKLQEVHEIVSRIVATRCDSFVCPRPRVIRGECKDEYQQLDRVEFYADGFKCQKTVVENWKRVRCACPKARTVHTACVGLYRNVIKYTYHLDEKAHVCHESSQKMKIRCRCPAVKKEVSECQDMIRRTKFTFFRLVSGGPEGFKCEPQFAWRSIRCDCPPREITHGPCKNNFRVKKTTLYNLVQGHCVSEIKTTEIQCACPKPKIHTSACDGSHVAVRVQVENLNSENHCDKSIYVGFKPCQQSCKNAMDVAILVDTSKSMDYSNFPAVKSFVASMVQDLPVSRAGTHVALGRFSSTGKIGLLFDFFTFYKAQQAVDRINDMRFHQGSSSTAEALQLMRLTTFSKSHGSRPEVSRVLYLITDSESNGSADVISEARKLRAMGIQIVVIGVGPHITPGYMQKLASKPHSINVFLVRDFDSLMGIKGQALESRCDAPGTVNHISVMKDISAKLREISAVGGLDYTPLGLTKLDVNEMSLLGFSIKSYFSVVAGTQEWQQARFREHMQEQLAKALDCKIYEIVDFKTEAKDTESKSIRVTFKMDRQYGAPLVKMLTGKKITFVSINKKEMPKPEDITYVSPYALKGYEYTAETMGLLREIGDETLQLMKHSPKKDHEQLEARIHNLNEELHEARKFLSTDQSKLVGLASKVTKGAVVLAKQAIDMAKVLATEQLDRKDIETWDVHVTNRHLRNLHELVAAMAVRAKMADTELKVATQDDVTKGKVLPPKNTVATITVTQAPATTAKPKKK